MAKKTNTLVNEIMGTLLDMGGEIIRSLPRPFETPYEHIRRTRSVGWKRYYDTVHSLEKRGALKIISQKGQKFIQLTKQGQLETLLAKAVLPQTGKWDGKWRLVIFDIPEDAKGLRDKLRKLLKVNNFVKLQASVFVSPYVLNRKAIAYLKETGLIDYIRLLKVEEIDDDKDLRKKFELF